MQIITVRNEEAGQRLNKFLGKYLSGAPVSFIYKMLRKKNIVLNGKKADGAERLNANDEIKLFLSDETIAKFTGSAVSPPGAASGTKGISFPEEFAGITVVYENSNIILFNKPAGILSQKACKTDVSMVEYLLSYLTETGFIKQGESRGFQPGICNRLDRNTSGLLIAGKTLAGSQVMSELIKERRVRKFYRCIVKGVIVSEQTVDGYLIKNEKSNTVKVAKTAAGSEDWLPVRTRYIPICNNGSETFLEVELITGRTHQIRAHLASIGHPIAGDSKYGSESFNKRFMRECGLDSQLLHAYRLEFPAEAQNDIQEKVLSDLFGKSILAPLPQRFEKILSMCKLNGQAW